MPTARNSASTDERLSVGPALTANVLVALVLGVAAYLAATDTDVYYRSVQEDGFLEWATFWSFALAAVAMVVAGVGQRRSDSRIPWFLWGVAAFCLFVAMEEISWGQRLFGFRPPEYFLRENFQQELNIHNVFPTSFRKLLLKAVILGYGVALPLFGTVTTLRKKLTAFGIVTPPLALIPAFVATFITYQTYPWTFAGEWAELMLGLGFLGAATSYLTTFNVNRPGKKKLLQMPLAGAALTGILAAGSTGLSRLRPAETSQMIKTAQSELEALARDFIVRGRTASRCGIHKRVFSFVEKYDRNHLYDGEFAGLVARGLPEERARFFLDPWNSPIWIRHTCDDRTRRQKVFVYSFGPDRRRDSSPWEIRGDDIGVMIPEGGF